jgi:hypothetical protein
MEWTSWKHNVETYFDFYKKEFAYVKDKIFWVEKILTQKALGWHQAGFQGPACQRLEDN